MNNSTVLLFGFMELFDVQNARELHNLEVLSALISMCNELNAQHEALATIEHTVHTGRFYLRIEANRQIMSVFNCNYCWYVGQVEDTRTWIPCPDIQTAVKHACADLVASE